MVRLDVDSLSVGEEIRIPAWWRKDEPTLCRVEEIWGAIPRDLDSRIIVVRPLEGNPHARTVRVYPPAALERTT